MIKTPTYSIVIPVYKRVFGFHDALESALNVTGCQEVVVVDDNSDHEEFLDICNSFNDERVKYHRNEQNIGLFGNWNKGIELSAGEFVSVLCSDDIIAADAYNLFLNAYEKDPEMDVFFGSFCTFTTSTDQIITHRSFPDGRMEAADLIKDAVEHGPGFSVLSVIRKSAVLQYPFVAKPHSGNDWLWIYGNASSLKLHAVSRPINFWRRHPDQDAAKSQSITTDCWPLMYIQMEEQLKQLNNNLADKAVNRAKGIVLSWLLNDHVKRESYFLRLNSAEAESNYFLAAAIEIIKGDWLLSGLLKSKKGSSFYYNMGRIARKTAYYPAT